MCAFCYLWLLLNWFIWLPLLPCPYSYKEHHPSLTWKLSQASPCRGCCNEAQEHTWQQAGWKDASTILLWYWMLVHSLRQIKTPENSIWAPPNSCETARIFKMDKISRPEIYVANHREIDCTHKHFWMTEYLDKVENRFLESHLANGV